MVASEFWLVLFSVAVIGLLLSMALRRIGAKLLSRNKQRERCRPWRDEDSLIISTKNKGGLQNEKENS